jgi:hypothetical protein
MADPATEASLTSVINHLTSKNGDKNSWLKKISQQLDSKGASGDDPFGGFKIPKLTDIAKGLTFGLAPGLIKKSVSGMQIFMNSLNAMQVDDIGKSGAIIQLVDEYSDAMSNFADIPWMKALKGTFLLSTFSDVFIELTSELGSDENLKKIKPLSKFAKAFGEPLKLIGNALNSFGKINWITAWFGSKFLTKFVRALTDIAISFTGNKKGFESFGEILGKLNEALSKFARTFNGVQFGKLLKGSKVLERVILSLLSPAKAVSKNKQALERFGETLNSFAIPLTTFVTAFNDMKIFKMFIGVKVLGKIIEPLVVIAKAVSKNKSVFERFGETLSKVAEPLKAFGETFDKIGNSLIKASVSLLIVAGALALSAYSFKLFKDVEWPKVVAGVLALLGISTSLLILSKVSKDIIKAAAAIAIVAASLGIAALSFKLFGDTKWWDVLAGVGILAAIMGGLVAMGVLLSGPQMGLVLVAAAVMGIVSLAMIPFAMSLKLLSGVDWAGFDGIFTALAKLAAGVALLQFVIPGLIAGALALIPFALGLKILSSIDWNTFEGISESLKLLAEGVKEISFFNMIKAGYAMVPFAAGIVLLRIAVGKGKTLPTFLEKFNASTKDLNGESLISASKGILALSGALVAMAGSQVVSGVGTLIGKILRFGGDGPIEQLIKLAKHGYNLSILGMGVRDLANGLKTLAGFTSELDIFETLADKFKSLDALDPTGIKAFAEGINSLAIALTALSALDGQLSVLDQIPYDKLKSLSESIKPGAPLIQIVNGLKESEQSKETSMILQKGIRSNPPTVGAQLGKAGNIATTPMIIVNNNTGGNVTNNTSTSSNVNNNGSVNTPIITASGSGMFTNY